MSKKHPEGLRDFPASQPWADLIDKGPGSSAHPKRLPADKKSVERALANLQKISGFTPPTEADTKPLEPVTIFHGESPAQAEKPASKGGPRKKITPAWHSDPEPIMGVATDPYKRRRALGSDAGHDKTVWSQKRRKNLGLPEKALPFKDRLMAINALTPEDLIIIKEKLGYKPERIHQYAPLTQELILHKLHAYKDWVRNQTVKV